MTKTTMAWTRYEKKGELYSQVSNNMETTWKETAWKIQEKVDRDVVEEDLRKMVIDTWR